MIPRQYIACACLVTVFSVTGASITQAQGDWREAVSTGGNFRVMFPGSPSYRSREISTPFGDAHEDRCDLSFDGGDASYRLLAAKSIDAPEFIKSRTVKERIDFFLESSVSAVRQQFPDIHLKVKRRAASWHGYPGEHVQVSGRHAGGWVDHEIRYFYVEDVCYMVESMQIGAGPRKILAAADVAKFLDSFELLSVPGNEAREAKAPVAPDRRRGPQQVDDSGWIKLSDAGGAGEWTELGAADVLKFSPGGTIRGSGGVGYLVSQHVYDDFELTGRMKVSASGNGGIFFRVPKEMRLDKPLGYELQLYVRKSGDSIGTGSIWLDGKLDNAIRNFFEVPDRWYSFHIRCEGSSILVKVDDQVVYRRSDAARRAGHLALQNYHAGGEVHYADLKIRRLPVEQKQAEAGLTAPKMRSWTNAAGTRTIQVPRRRRAHRAAPA